MNHLCEKVKLKNENRILKINRIKKDKKKIDKTC